jgi:hypothetical protein
MNSRRGEMRDNNRSPELADIFRQYGQVKITTKCPKKSRNDTINREICAK